MRVFAAGASVAIGMRLVAQLTQAGHEVVGASRSPQKAAGLEALEQAQAGIYNIVDDEPAPVRDWLPVLAKALGAKPPRHFPSRLARLVAGEAGVVMATRTRGASNANANRGLGWTPRYPTWRKGFAAAYATTTVGPRTTNHPRGSSADARIARPHSPRVEPRARGDGSARLAGLCG